MPIRIIGGEFRGRTIPSPTGRIRPTASLVRKALFDILGDIVGLSFCDLFAGTGAVGIEAAGRGAGYVEFVESDSFAASSLNKLLGSFGLRPEVARIRPMWVRNWVASGVEDFDIIFADPPYLQAAISEVGELLPAILSRLSREGIFVLQIGRKLEAPGGYSDARIFGDDRLLFYDSSDIT